MNSKGRGFYYGHLIIDNDLLEYLPSGLTILFISAGNALQLVEMDFTKNFS